MSKYKLNHNKLCENPKCLNLREPNQSAFIRTFKVCQECYHKFKKDNELRFKHNKNIPKSFRLVRFKEIKLRNNRIIKQVIG